jgi:hypothetical protein
MQPIFVPSTNRHLFDDRIAEAYELLELARGTRHEDACWRYYEAVQRLAAIARGPK